MENKKMEWHIKEGIKYSDLYKDGYPIGNPFGLIKLFEYDKDLKALDLGCGRGILARHFKDYTGVDVSEYIVELNKSEYPNKRFRVESLHNLKDLKDEKFDLVICADVMEHIPEDKIDDVLKEMSKLDVKKYAFSISTRKSVFLDKNNENLHLTVWKSEKWESKLKEYFNIVKKVLKPNLLNIEVVKK